MPYDLYGVDALAWEINPSTRASVHLWNKYRPIDVTLSAAGTAEDLFNVSTDAPAVNLITNPSMETGDPPTGFTAAGSTISQSGAQQRSGSNSLSINPDNSAAGEGAYWVTEELASQREGSQQVYAVASVYLRDAAGSGDDARIEIRDSTGGTVHSTGNTVTLSATWTRSSCAFPLTITGSTYRIYIVTVSQHNTTFFADDMQLELSNNSTSTTYVDGTQGVDYEWDGTAHASISRRRYGLVAIRGFDLHTDLDCYVAFNHTASSTTGVFFRAGTTWSPAWPVHFHNISIINVNASETPRVRGVIWGTHLLKPAT